MPPRFALLATLACALALASVLERGQALWQPQATLPDWSGAQWLQYPGGSEVLYLRKGFVVSHLPARASVRVSATDEFEIFVNGTRVGSAEYVGARPIGVYSLLGVLRPGLNVLAIRAASRTMGQSASALAVVEWGGPEPQTSVTSDASWRAENRQLRSALGTRPWTDNAFHDLDWAHAHEAPSAQVSGSPFAPSGLLSSGIESLSGQYFWTTERDDTAASFERLFTIDDPMIRGASLGICASGEGLISINGVMLGPVTTTEGRMLVLEVAPYLRRGTNRVLVTVTGSARAMRLGVRGEVQLAQGRLDFSGDDRWTVSPKGSPVRLLGEIARNPPRLVPQSDVAVRGGLWRSRLAYLGYFAASSALLLLFGTGYAWSRKLAARPAEQAWATFARGLAALTALIVLIHLIDADPRFCLTGLYPFWLPAGILTLAAGWLLASMASSRGEPKSAGDSPRGLSP